MRTICLVACASRKKDGPRSAEELYDSALFDGSRNYAKNRSDDWFILSAKHGLTPPSTMLAPYDESLVGTTSSFRQAWAEQAFGVLAKCTSQHDRIIFLAGKPYREYLAPLLIARGNLTAAPLSSLGIGSQVAWLQKLASSQQRLKDLDRLYKLLSYLAESVGGARPLGQASAKSLWPERGLYLFFEAGEQRMSAPFDQRIVRVGTHSVSEGSKTTLWNRLRTHRGGLDMLGNHRGSIFRLHIGNALIRRHGVEGIFSTWSYGQSAPKEVRTAEEELEKLVSEYIGRMLVLWLRISDPPGAKSDRAYLERNIIALISGPDGAIDLGSGNWLGRDSPRTEISSSGLWNLNYLGLQYDPRMLDVLEQYVEITAGRLADPGRSLAPADWYEKSVAPKMGQISLL